MRPTGIVLIAIYHFLAAAFLVCLAIALGVGGSVLGAMFAAGNRVPLSGMGFFVGIVGAAFMLVFAVIAALAGYGVWTLREWGRICASCWLASQSFSHCPGCFSWACTSGFSWAAIA